MLTLDNLLQEMVSQEASDLFVATGTVPSMKVNGAIKAVNASVLDEATAETIIFSLMSLTEKKYFLIHHEANFAFSREGLGRFRVSAFFHQGQKGMVIRRIQSIIPSVEALGLPSFLNTLSMAKRGLILIVGPADAGKSTTLAAMLGYRNKTESGHIIAIEDPIEYIHTNQKCIFTQREVGFDTESYDVALMNAMRQAPDVISIGEIRTRDTMANALIFAETGHLCLSTLHAPNTIQAIDRVVNFFPLGHRNHIWMDLSLNLQAIIAQRLIPAVGGGKRVVATEILLNTPIIANYIRKGEFHLLKEIMGQKNQYNMVTFDQSLYNLFMMDKISYEDALLYADSENDVRLKIKLSGKMPQSGISSNSLDDINLTDNN